MTDENQARWGQEPIESGHRALAGVAIEIDEQVPAEDDVMRWPIAEKIRIDEVSTDESHRLLHRRIQGKALRAFMEVTRPERGIGPPEGIQAVHPPAGFRERPVADVHGVDAELRGSEAGVEERHGDGVGLLPPRTR